MGNIKGILIDSGRVLNFPATGSWSYSPKFLEIVGKDKFNSILKPRRKAAFNKAWKYIKSISTISNVEEEWSYFRNFFNIISNELPELKLSEEKKNLVTDDFVFNYEKYIFYDDVFDILPELSKKYKICLVSDAWPSPRGVFKKAKLYDYFDSMIISSEVGTTKPDKLMYNLALDKLELNVDQVVFIDDNFKNCDGAYRLGIKSIVLSRNLLMRIYNSCILRVPYKVVKNLYEVEKLL